jgi:hypothetical protein
VTAELAIPQPASEIVQPGWWHEVAQPVIDRADWDELEKYSKELKAFIGIFEALGREDKIELTKAQRVVERRRGELLGELRPRPGRPPGKLQHDVINGLHASTATNYKRINAAWAVIEVHLLEATDSKQVSQRALLDIARTVLEDEEEPVASNGTKIPRAKRAKQIARLADKGNTADQISQKLGISKAVVQSIANEYEVALPMAHHHSSIDPNDVIERVVSSLEADVAALDLIRGTEETLDRSQIERWVNSLNDSLSRLRKHTNQLKELTHDKE